MTWEVYCLFGYTFGVVWYTVTAWERAWSSGERDPWLLLHLPLGAVLMMVLMAPIYGAGKVVEWLLVR